MEVDIFIPCTVDQFYPSIGFNMIKVLKKLDVICYYNANQGCCGQTVFNAGFWEDAKSMGEKFINEFSSGRLVVSPSISCENMVQNNFPLMFHNSSKHIELKVLQQNMFEIADFLVNKMNARSLGAKFHHIVTIHDSCSKKSISGPNFNIRTLLEHVKGIQIVEMFESDYSCGSGAIFSVENESISIALAQQTVEKALITGAEYIVCSEPSCMLNLQSYIDKNKLQIQTIHFLDILAAGWED